MTEKDIVTKGWTEELMMENKSLYCDDCSHPVSEHYFPGQRDELKCDVPYCECSGLQPYSLSAQLEDAGQERMF